MSKKRDDPSDVLAKDLRALQQPGLSPKAVQAKCPHVLELQVVRDMAASEDAADIAVAAVQAVRDAIDAVDDARGRDSATILYALKPGTRGQNKAERMRTVAVREDKEYETIRTSFAPRIAREVADELRAIDASHRSTPLAAPEQAAIEPRAHEIELSARPHAWYAIAQEHVRGYRWLSYRRVLSDLDADRVWTDTTDIDVLVLRDDVETFYLDDQQEPSPGVTIVSYDDPDSTRAGTWPRRGSVADGAPQSFPFPQPLRAGEQLRFRIVRRTLPVGDYRPRAAVPDCSEKPEDPGSAETVLYLTLPFDGLRFVEYGVDWDGLGHGSSLLMSVYLEVVVYAGPREVGRHRPKIRHGPTTVSHRGKITTPVAGSTFEFHVGEGLRLTADEPPRADGNVMVGLKLGPSDCVENPFSLVRDDMATFNLNVADWRDLTPDERLSRVRDALTDRGARSEEDST